MEKVEDAIFSDIKARFGEATLVAAKFALKAILQLLGAGRALRPRAGKAAQYQRGLTEHKTDALQAVHYHLCDREAQGLEIPRCGETLLSQMAPDYVLAKGNIVDFNVVDDQVLDAAGADESADENECAEAACFNSGTHDDKRYYGELLPVSIVCLRNAVNHAVTILDIKQPGDFRRSLKSIPRAALRVASTSADIETIKCYSSLGIVFLREARLRTIHAAAERSEYEAVRAVGALEKRNEIDQALIALVLPAVYCVGTLARLVQLDTLALARVLRSVRQSAQHALDASALDACVATAIAAASAGKKPRRCSPRNGKSGTKTSNKSQDNTARTHV